MSTGQNIADEARGDLNDNDSGNYRWSDAELLRYINAAQRQIVFLLPEANVSEAIFTLAAGSRQTLPSGGTKFLGAYNVAMGPSESSVRGRSITIVEEDALDTGYPTWAVDYFLPDEAAEVTYVVQHITHDPRDPTAFAVYPAPPDAAQEIFLKQAKLPTALAALSDTFALRDEFFNPAVEYTKFRMQSKDGRFGTDADRRTELWNNFLRALGIKVDADRRVDPALTRPPADSHG